MFSNVIAHHVPFAKTSPQPHENEWKRQISILSSYYCERCSDLADFPSVPGPHFENHWFTFWGLNEIAVTIDTHPTSCEEKAVCFPRSRLGISLNINRTMCLPWALGQRRYFPQNVCSPEINVLNLAHLTMYLVFSVHATYISIILVLKVKI